MGEGITIPVLPRWEWRTFAAELQLASSVIEAARVGEPVRNEDIYLLGHTLDYNVKCRDDQIDIKHLDAVSPEGLEQWRPVLKEAFPIRPATLLTVCRALGIPAPVQPRDHYEQPDLLRDAVTLDARLIVVPIPKLRGRLIVEGCDGEFVTFELRGRRHQSLAFEHRHPGMVLAALRHLGLQSTSNTNYPKGLRQILAAPPGLDFHTQGAA